MTEQPKCETCRWWFHQQCRRWPPVAWYEAQGISIAYIGGTATGIVNYPPAPRPLRVGEWLSTAPTDFCGEHERREQEQPQ